MSKIYREMKKRYNQMVEADKKQADEYDEIGFDQDNEFDQNIVETSTYRIEKIVLSCNGPMDYFEFKIQNQEIVEITYTSTYSGDLVSWELSGDEFDYVAARFDWMTFDPVTN